MGITYYPNEHKDSWRIIEQGQTDDGTEFIVLAVANLNWRILIELPPIVNGTIGEPPALVVQNPCLACGFERSCPPGRCHE